MVPIPQERHAEAVPLLEESLHWFQQANGHEIPDCADVWSNLAVAFANTGDQKRARHASANAQAIREGRHST
jgi:predicted Zn-dependent protease